MSSVTTRETALRVALVAMGLVTTLPALALITSYALEWTYGVIDPEPMTLALLQHRGMLQLLLGAALVWAAFFPPARRAAAIAAVAGKSTFLLLILPDPDLRADLAPLQHGGRSDLHRRAVGPHRLEHLGQSRRQSTRLTRRASTPTGPPCARSRRAARPIQRLPDQQNADGPYGRSSGVHRVISTPPVRATR
ncbi:hypothetical protein ACFSKW_44830 [Nonomuraea mangrovi]|uniref:Uncharacterized protein n=1 Tax=Nonomuraea mangrovi TaxID=2316207 RepID=A0ABW4TC91_9ACTN